MKLPVSISLCVAFFPNLLWAEPIFYSEIESQSYSEAAPIDQMVHDLVGPPIDAGEFAFTHNRLELGLRWRQWEVSYFSRLDYHLRFNSETARLIYLDKNRVPVTENESFSVFLETNALRAQGLGLGYDFQLNQAFSGHFRANYLYASDVTDGELRGVVETRDAEYSGDLVLDYGYSEDLLLNRPTESVKGQGLSLDLDLFWTFDQSWRLRFQARDLYSRIRWSDLTYTRASATTDTISYDVDGTLHSIPGVAGVEGYHTQMQVLPRRYTLAVDYPLGENLRASAELFSYANHRFPRLALGWRVGPVNLETSYDFAAEAFGVKVRHAYLSLLLRTDKLEVDEARTLELALQLQLAI